MQQIQQIIDKVFQEKERIYNRYKNNLPAASPVSISPDNLNKEILPRRLKIVETHLY